MRLCSMADFRAVWSEVAPSSPTMSQVVRCFLRDDLAGALTLAVRNAQDADDASVGLMWALTEPDFRGGDVGVFLIQEVRRRFPDARITAGPLGDDEDSGPRYRLRCWEDAKVPVHEAGCGATSGDEDCECLAWIRREVIHRLGKRRDLGGSSEEVMPSQQYKQSILALNL